MKNEELKINYKRISYDEIDSEDMNLYEFAHDSLSRAYAPYSRFKVGAAVKLANDVIITGNNQENMAYPSGLCAERVALFYANSKYPDIPVTDIFIIAQDSNGSITSKPVTPCGACRQVMIENEKRNENDLRIMMAGREDIFIFDSAKDILPFEFDLNIND